MVGDGGTGLRGPITCGADTALLPGAILVESVAADGPRRVAPSAGAIRVAVVSDHASGLAALRDGARHYLLAGDVDGPAAEAVAVALQRGDEARNAGFRDGPIDDMHCIGSESFRWLIHYSSEVAHRRGEIGYLILIHLVPDDAALDTPLAAAVCAQLCTTTRSADVVSWLGDSWFGILVSTSVSLEGAHALVGRLGDALGAPLSVDGRAVQVRYDLGLTTYGSANDDAESVLVRAAAAADQSSWTYHAKSQDG